MKKKSTTNLYYFMLVPNFGDLLNIYIFNRLFNINPHYSEIKNCNMVAIGSLFELLFSKRNHFIKRILYPTIDIWGTGFIKEESIFLYPSRRFKIHAVRGYLTLERLKKYRVIKDKDNIVIGDPGLLASKLINLSKVKKKYDLGIIPHYVDINSTLLDNIKIKNSIILDVTKNPMDLLYDIANCKTIISSAMHGLICADSLGIPNIRMILSDNITGGNYKFDDYYSVFGITNHNRIDLRTQKITSTDIIINNYKITQKQVKEIQDNLIKSFPNLTDPIQ